MLRLTLTTSAGIFLTMLAFGARPNDTISAATFLSAPQPAAAEVEFDLNEVAAAARGNVTFEIPNDDDGLIAVAVADAPHGYVAEAPAVAADQAASGPLYVVNGSRVNLRAGPSVRREVVGQLGRGDRAVMLGEATGTWMHVLDPETGREGYMSARYLLPVQSDA